MKNLKWVLVVLLLAALACSTVGGGEGNSAANNAAADNDTTASSNDTSTDDNTGSGSDDAAGADDDAAEDSGGGGGLGIFSELSADSTCYSAFLPINRELTWTYEIDSADIEPTIYTIAVTDVSNETITSTMTFPEVSSTVVWYCGPDGLFSSNFAQFDFATLPGDVVNFETLSFEGLTLPKAELWEVGYTWNMSFLIEMSMMVEDIPVVSTMSADLISEITAIESVTVPAGTFPQAYKVEQTGSMSFETMGFLTEVPMNTTTWYVKDVGMIKSVSEDSFGTSTTVLVSVD